MNLTQIAAWDADWAERFPQRLTRKQKRAFVDELEQALQARSFATERIRVRTLLQNELLVTECDEPDVIFTAHYDTPTIMPFWLGWLYDTVGHTRQIEASLLLLILLYLPLLLTPVVPAAWQPALSFANLVYVLLMLAMVTLFVPNPHNREDNTSGVIALMALADWLQDRPDLKKRVQFAFLDNEELGLLGSRGLRAVWDKRRHQYWQAAIINLDCVSRGAVPLVVCHREKRVARRVLPYLRPFLPNAQLINLRLLPLSDNYTFRREGAINISYADKSAVPGGYYIPKIHSPADNDFFPEKLLPLLQGLAAFMEEDMTDERRR